MKITHIVISRQIFGSERYCADLASHQSGQGHQVTVIAGRGTRDSAALWRRELPDAVRLVTPPRGIPTLLLGPWMAWALRREKPEIVHMHLLKGTGFVALMKKIMGFGLVASMHIRYRKKYHAACDGLVLLNDNQRESLKGYKGRAMTVWNWASPKHRAAQGADGGAFRASLGVKPDDFLFLCVARLTPVKGTDILAQSFLKAFPGQPGVKLVLVGDGEERDRIEALAGGDKRILLTGFLMTGPDLFRAGDAFVNAASFEPFSLAILEAMAAGCPLVLTRTAGSLGFLAGDKRVMWAEIKDIDSLAAALVTAHQRGKQRVAYDMTPFDIATAAAKIEALYREIPAGTRAAGPAL